MHFASQLVNRSVFEAFLLTVFLGVGSVVLVLPLFLFAEKLPFAQEQKPSAVVPIEVLAAPEAVQSEED